MKKILSLFLAMALLVGCIPVNACAEEATYPKVTHSYTTTDDFASDEWSTDQRGAYLLSGRASISRPDSTHINISGNTNATQTCDKVRLTLFVERSTYNVRRTLSHVWVAIVFPEMLIWVLSGREIDDLPFNKYVPR